MDRFVVLTLLSAGGAGIFYSGYSYFFVNKKTKEDKQLPATIGQKWSKFWISTTSDSDKDAWKNKNSKLIAAVESTLHPDLKNMRSAFRLVDLQNWCIGAASAEYEGADSSYLESVRGYCTFDIRDKLNKKVIGGGDTWADANDRLKKASEPLSIAMIKVKSKLTAQQPQLTDTDALKNWCISSYGKPWLGDDDSDFIDVQAYCTSPVK